MTIQMSEYQSATENYVGWCTTCREFTRNGTEPDAEDYDCPQCGENTVIGAENALVAGLIEVSA